MWKDALGRYALKTRVRAKEVEIVWREYEDVSFPFLLGPKDCINRVFSSESKISGRSTSERTLCRATGRHYESRS